jgi:catabolite regulation protein CreA
MKKVKLLLISFAMLIGIIRAYSNEIKAIRTTFTLNGIQLTPQEVALKCPNIGEVTCAIVYKDLMFFNIKKKL